MTDGGKRRRELKEEKNPIKKNVEVVDPIQWQHADQSMIEID